MPRQKAFKLPTEFTDKTSGRRNINAQININLYNTVRLIAQSEGKTLTDVLTQMFSDYIEKNRAKAEELTSFKFT